MFETGGESGFRKTSGGWGFGGNIEGERGGRATKDEVEGRGACGTVYVTVVCVSDGGGVNVPIVLVFVNVIAKGCEKGTIVAFNLSVSLRVVRRGKDVV